MSVGIRTERATLSQSHVVHTVLEFLYLLVYENDVELRRINKVQYNFLSETLVGIMVSSQVNKEKNGEGTMGNTYKLYEGLRNTIECSGKLFRAKSQP